MLTFPCDFPVKVIGKKTLGFAEEIIAIAFEHFPAISRESITFHDSSNANYLGITINLYVEDQESLDKLYYALTKHPDIKMVL